MSENASRDIRTRIPIKLIGDTGLPVTTSFVVATHVEVAYSPLRREHRPHRRRRLTLTIPTRSASVGRAASTAPKI